MVNKDQFMSRFSQFRKEYSQQIKPLLAYWTRMTQREQQLVTISLVLVVIFVSFSILNWTMSLRDNLSDQFNITQVNKLQADILSKQFKELSQISTNEFSQASSDRVRGDVSQILEVKEPNVVTVGDTLSVSVDSSKFISIMLFLDQMRNSYGLFPKKLRITRLSQSGYASFTASFTVEQQ